jgi:hypothetical protein
MVSRSCSFYWWEQRGGHPSCVAMRRKDDGSRDMSANEDTGRACTRAHLIGMRRAVAAQEHRPPRCCSRSRAPR